MLAYQMLTTVWCWLHGTPTATGQKTLVFLLITLTGGTRCVSVVTTILGTSQFAYTAQPYFYMHCKEFLDAGHPASELIPLRQYYQRHNRSIFWALQEQIPVCNNPIFRPALGWLLPPRVPFLKLIDRKNPPELHSPV